MRRFLIFFAFGSAFAAAVTGGCLTALLSRANELVLLDFDRLVRRDDVLWGPAFYQGGSYKLIRYRLTRPDILVLGSSRVTQFRDFMAPTARLYNASLAATSLEEAQVFIDAAFPRHKPTVLLLGIDPWWFSPQWAEHAPDLSLNRDLGEEGVNWRNIIANALAKAVDPHFLAALMARPLTADSVGGRQPVGYMASYLASGFRPDGSRQYGEELIVRQPYFDQAGFGYANGFRYYRDKIRTNTDRFSYVGPLSNTGLAALRRLIRTCQAQGVEPVLFLPPFPHAVYQEIQQSSTQRDYFARLEAAVAAVAAEEGASSFNFHDLAELSVSDRQSIDDIHVDEIATAAAFLRMRETSPGLRRLVPDRDVAGLQDRLNRPQTWATPNILAP